MDKQQRNIEKPRHAIDTKCTAKNKYLKMAMLNQAWIGSIHVTVHSARDKPIIWFIHSFVILLYTS